MEDDYLDDAAFYDGLEEDPGTPYLELTPPRWLAGEPVAEFAMPAVAPVPSWLHVPADAPPPPARLLTAEEFMAKHGLTLPDTDG
jgi:hypothetical protein